nr:retrovirus-related Pol polyprotein from transposon TNT 1-94 [Tanacetum cinerariifolium]
VPILYDNTSAIAISNNLVRHSTTKHIDIRYHFIRDHILKGGIGLHFVPTQYQIVDIFTKPLDEPTFRRLIVELGTNKEFRANDISKKIKMEDLLDLLIDIRSTFFTPDSPQDEPIIVLYECVEEVDVSNDKDTHASFNDVQLLQSQKDELEKQKAKVEAEVASLKARPSYPDINQLTNLPVTSFKPKFSKLLASHHFASCLPNALKKLSSKFTELPREIKELKKHVQDMEIELPGDLKEIITKLVLRILRSIFTLVYAVVQKLEKAFECLQGEKKIALCQKE